MTTSPHTRGDFPPGTEITVTADRTRWQRSRRAVLEALAGSHGVVGTPRPADPPELVRVLMPELRRALLPWQALDLSEAARRARLVTAETFAEVNRQRVVRWHPGFPGDDGWTGADWSNAMVGEAGEAANVVKKLRRQDIAQRGAVDPDRPVLLGKLADEVGDVYAYLDLLCQFYNLPNPVACAVEKFDRVSEREGFPDRMPQ